MVTTTRARIEPFEIRIPVSEIDDLHARLDATRWPEQLPGAPWERGVPVAYLRELVDYWRNEYDWRAQETRLNDRPHFTTEIDGQTIHFVHVSSERDDAIPLILLHGWPGSFLEFYDLIGPLVDPAGHGAPDAPAFHVVVPSLPGFGFSRPLADAGWTSRRTASALDELMGLLGYDRYLAQGGDYGAFVAPDMGRVTPDRVIGVHVNAPTVGFIPFGELPEEELAELSDLERERLDRMKWYFAEGNGYFQVQATRPQTLSYGLTDSPVGQLAWIVEKFKEWTNSGHELPEDAVDRDTILTDVTLYWLTGTAGSAANMYYETNHSNEWPTPSQVPTGVAVFAEDIAIRRYAEPLNNIVHWSDFQTGGHFAALETPDLLLNDIREFVTKLG